MVRVLRIVAWLIIGLAAIAGLGLWAAGPVWRTFLLDPPSDTDVLFWTQSQRDTGFALADQLPMIDTVQITAGGSVHDLPTGPDLTLDIDLDAFLADQNVAGLVVLHKGRIRVEHYGLHQTADKRWTSFSVAKSLTSTLVGAAIHDGHINSLDDAVSDYVDGLKGSAYDNVSIRALLTMTSGVDWDEDYDDPNSDVAQFRNIDAVEGEPAIVTYLKALPRAHEPGTVFNYSTGETNLVGVLVEAATGQSVADYLSTKVWGPYGMAHNASWVVSSTGEPISGCCVQATTRDFARFGQFLLDGAVIDGASILPEGWLAEATSALVATDLTDFPHYGYQWWIPSPGTYAANGIFGQGIFIDPSRELIIATNNSWQDARGHATGQRQQRFDFYRAVQAALDAEN